MGGWPSAASRSECWRPAGCAIGGVALGGAAAGLWAAGGGAFGLFAALGGLAIAGDYARGGSARAAHANDTAATDYFAASDLFGILQVILDHSRWFLVLALLPAVIALYRKAAPRAEE